MALTTKTCLLGPLILLLVLQARPSLQHARLMEPPSRASMWRFGYPTPKDEHGFIERVLSDRQDDNQSYCGGYGIQHGRYGGKCGICGDPWGDVPRAHEAPGGLYATGIIVKTYKQGSFVPVIVDITANHQGYFEFKICANNDVFQDPDQSCFDARPPLGVVVGNGGGFDDDDDEEDSNLLLLRQQLMLNGVSNRYFIHDSATGLRLVYVKLPNDVTCHQCIIQLSYVAGNNWGTCSNGTSAVGCGPQETFRGCADVRIEPNPLMPLMKNGFDLALSYDETVQESPEDSNHFDFDDNDDDDDDYSAANDVATRHLTETLHIKKLLLKQLLRRLRELSLNPQLFQTSAVDGDIESFERPGPLERAGGSDQLQIAPLVSNRHK